MFLFGNKIFSKFVLFNLARFSFKTGRDEHFDRRRPVRNSQNGPS